RRCWPRLAQTSSALLKPGFPDGVVGNAGGFLRQLAAKQDAAATTLSAAHAPPGSGNDVKRNGFFCSCRCVQHHAVQGREHIDCICWGKRCVGRPCRWGGNGKGGVL